jgi:hypothetical protein
VFARFRQRYDFESAPHPRIAATQCEYMDPFDSVRLGMIQIATHVPSYLASSAILSYGPFIQPLGLCDNW